MTRSPSICAGYWQKLRHSWESGPVMNADGDDPMTAMPLRTGQALQAAPDELRNHSRPQRALLAHMRQQLRPPINAMNGYRERLLEAAADQGKEEFVADLRRIHMASNQLLARVNDVFDPAQLEAGQLILTPDTSGGKLYATLRPPVAAIVSYSEMLLAD